MFTLKISTANEAFEDEYSEISRILRDLADKFDRDDGRRSGEKQEGSLRDINGNTVGKWELK